MTYLSQNSIAACIAGSIVVHALALSLVMTPSAQTAQDSQPPRPANELSVDLLPPPAAQHAQTAPDVSDDHAQILSQNQAAAQPCEDGNPEFIGVGMIVNPGSRIVSLVMPGYPAHAAGIRSGDRVDDPFIQVTADGWFNVQVEKPGGAVTALHIKAEKICYRDPLRLTSAEQT